MTQLDTLITADKDPGYVYILTNPSFKEDWVKIGKSSRPVEVRSSELDNTAVPLPFEIYATIKTVKYSEVERQIHKSIDRISDLRIRQNREFFNIAPAVATDMLMDLAKLLDDAEVCRYQDNVAYKIYPVAEAAPTAKTDKDDAHGPQRSNFRFSMVGLSAGDTIQFDPNPSLKVVIADDRKIEYGGRLMSLSAFTVEHMPEDKRNASGAYQGPKYFSHNGKTLWELRLEKERKELDAAQEDE